MAMTEVRETENLAAENFDAIDALREALNSVLRGKAEVVDQVVICLLARGHLLIEDRPGLGKTTLAKALVAAIGGRFARVQCTPDLLPSDITGFNIFNQKTQEFEFRPGPVFSEVLLADEINRATPRTQSALLEAMAERQVTLDAVRYPLAPEFFVIATQNPSEQHGTYPLPEAQLDRFALKLSIGYPGPEDEMAMLSGALGRDEGVIDEVATLFSAGQLRRIQCRVASIAVVSSVHDYLVRLARATRSNPHIALGLSPRGLLMWQRCAQAQAFLHRREFVTPDDVQEVAMPVLSVRLVVDADDPRPVLVDLLESIPVPECELKRN